MKKIYLITLLAILINANPLPSVAADRGSSGTISAYYFHGDVRCLTCRKLEQYSKEAIENGFKDDLATGRLRFQSINTDEKGNEHFINDYQLYTKSLILSLIKDGKEVKYKNLTKIWELVGNKQKFYDYVNNEVAGFLKEA